MKVLLKGNKNYCATIVKIENIVPIEGANSIAIAPIFGNSIIVGVDTKTDTTGIYFPLETSISKDFLKANNLLRDKTQNKDSIKAGFFEDNGRVKALRMLKGSVKSEGFFIPLSGMKEYLGKDFNENDFPIGLDFDTVNGKTLCKKYVILTRTPSSNIAKNQKKSVKKKESKLIPEQFHFHIDTPQLKKEIRALKPGDLVELSTKIHGSSFISSKVLCKKKLNPIEAVLKFLGVNIVSTQYDFMWSSRRVLKGDVYEAGPGYYGEDIWGLVHEKIKNNLQDGMTIYGEVYGQLSNGSWIQKDYDYGCEPGTWDFMIYRITTTDHNGKVFEWSTRQVREYCGKLGMKVVPALFYGTLANYLDSRKVSWDERNFHDVLLKTLMDEYLEKDSVLCKNKVPEEGIVLRKESLDIEVWKLKAFRFLERETEALTKGESNIEDEQTEEEIK